LSNDIGNIVLDIIDDDSNDNNDYMEGENVTSSISSNSSDDTDKSEISSESLVSDDDISNIPVLMIPCDKLKNNIDDDIEKNVIEHYIKCKKCDKTNNNNSEIIFDDTKFIYKKIYDENKINTYFNFYDNLKCYNKDLSQQIFCYEICNDNHQYNECFILLYENKIN
jgi:hypothetical protein